MQSSRLSVIGLVLFVAPVSCGRGCNRSSSTSSATGIHASPTSTSPVGTIDAAVDAFVDAAAANSLENAAIADDDVVLPSAPILPVTTLAKSNERLYGLSFDASYLYVHTPHGARRIARAGGALEKAKGLADGGGPGDPDPTHAYYGGAEFEASSTSDLDHYLITSDAVLVQADNGAAGQLAKSLDASGRKAIVVQSKTGRAFWFEPAIHAVITGAGAPVKPAYVSDVWSADGADLAFANGRIYVLDPLGRLASTKADGSDTRYLGNLWPDLTTRLATVWISIDDTTLYAVADGGAASESRIVKVDLALASGAPVMDRYGGLICARRIAVTDVANEKKLASATELLDFFADDLKAGDATIVLAPDGPASDATASIEAFLRRHYGANVKIERRSPAAGKPTTEAIVIGMERSALTLLLQP